MNEKQLPEHIATFIQALRDNPSLIAGAGAAVADRAGTEASQAAAEYYQSQGYTITADELLDLIFATNSTAAEELDDAELHQVSGGTWGPSQQADFDMAVLLASLEQVTITRPRRGAQ